MSVSISLPEAEAKLAAMQREAQELAGQIEALSMVTEGLRRLNGHAVEWFAGAKAVAAPAEAEPAAKHPVGRAAVREIVQERPGLWALRDIADEAMRRGWATDRKPIEVAVHRMTRAGEARRVGHGRYAFGDQEVIAA